MKSIANYPIWMRANCHFLSKFQRILTLLGLAVLTACATPSAPPTKAVYDFGANVQAPAQASVATAASVSTSTSTAANSPTRTAALALPEIETHAALESSAMLYRLAYADAQQLQPYAMARWSMPPAQLVRARVRDAFAARGPVVSVGEGTEWRLSLELDEFSHWFESPSSSQGLVRLRATLTRSERIVAQTTLLARQSAPTQDAAGGAKALRASTDELVQQLIAWVSQHQR
jgi:cholesterol transport system auxiliary component